MLEAFEVLLQQPSLMAHHQQTYYTKMLAAQGLSSGNPHGSAGTPAAGEEELASDVDEPPDSRIQFAKVKSSSTLYYNPRHRQSQTNCSHLVKDRKESLLTQALLSSPELNPTSDTEAPVLTSDGGLTSPARTTTPSPPLPIPRTGLAMSTYKDETYTHEKPISTSAQISIPKMGETSQETGVEVGLGRKRCISFACGRQQASPKSSEPPMKTQAGAQPLASAASPPKRPCMLKFVCPMKPLHVDTHKSEKRGKSPSPIKQMTSANEVMSTGVIPQTGVLVQRDPKSTIKGSPLRKLTLPSTNLQSRKGRIFNRVNFQESEATRFHEFACHFSTEDEWTNEQTAYRQKITVNDTLRKENAIRKLAEEAEEEALDEEAEDNLDDDIQDDDRDVDVISDDGNETDDEEGFADSDDDSDEGSNYQFWTPALTTAATSTDHVEHIRPTARRVASESSIGSITKLERIGSNRASNEFHNVSPRLLPDTFELLDSSEFVVGTVDEDRPLEEAYMSCLEERKRSKHKVIPQDIDPSFPTSEPEAGNCNEDDDDEQDDDIAKVESEPRWGRGRLEASEYSEQLSRSKNPIESEEIIPSTGLPKRTPPHTPKRLQSPPSKRAVAHRSPPPRRLFGQATHRLRSPPPTHRKLTSPPSSRRSSKTGSPSTTGFKIDIPHLAQRPNLTHTTSLPRTPNPFWGQHRRTRFDDAGTPSPGTSPKKMSQRRPEVHSRGPIDIVQGLETKRQRRKDKFWRQHCRSLGKEKHRRCQPGKGAERMKELGLEMADRFRGYGQRAQLVLSL